MLIIQASSFPAFSARCIQCGKRMQSDRAPIFADCQGEPFKAYFCEPCATVAIQLDK